MSPIVALDAMGGDHGPSVVVPAALAALTRYSSLRLVLVGDEAAISAALASANDALRARIDVKHAAEQVEMHDKPSAALRNKRNSSMRYVVDLVKAGEVQACVSAGNTGALMAIARYVLKTLQGLTARPSAPPCPACNTAPACSISGQM